MAGSTVWYNGRIWTGRRIVGCLVAEEGRVVHAGTGGPGGREVPTGAERVDLDGGLVVPAFLDAHLHVTEVALRRAGVDLRGTRSLPEIGDRVHRQLGRVDPPAVWGGGWDQELLEEHRMPTRADLDRLLPDRPLLLTRGCEHVAVVNSAALDHLGIGPTTPDPPGGTLDRDAAGTPTGILREQALRLLDDFPFPTLTERPDLGEGFLTEASALGLAAVASLRATPEEFGWMTERVGSRSGIPVPRYLAYGRIRDAGDIDAWARRRRSGDRAVAGVKLFADGSFGARSAWLEAPYADEPSSSGGPVLAPREVEAMVRAADAAGLRVAVHAIGDRALGGVVEALDRAGPQHRPRIEHASLVPPDLVEGLSHIGADVVVQPGFRRSDTWLQERLGPDRVRSAYAFATFRRRGIRLAGSSDAPVEPLDPLDGLHAAAGDAGFGESLTALEALELYTIRAGPVLDLPDLGHLETGATASLVAFPVQRLEDLPRLPVGAPRKVWLEGRPVRRGPGPFEGRQRISASGRMDRA